MTIGEPRETMPAFVVDKLAEAEALFAKYPPIRGTDELRKAIAAWIGRRYGLAGEIDFSARGAPAQRLARGPVLRAAAGGRAQARRRPAGGAAAATPTTRPISAPTLAVERRAGLSRRHRRRPAICPISTRWRRDPALLRRTVAFYLCSPANPQGAVADAAYLAQGARAGPRLRLHAVLRRVLLGDLHAASRRSAGSRSPPRRRSASRTSSSSTRCRSAPTCPACARASAPATATSSRRWPRSAT